MKSSRRTPDKEHDDFLGADAGSAEIRKLLQQRAREKASTLRWNSYTLVLAYAILAAIAVLELRHVDSVVVAATAVAGLAIIWVFSQIQAKRIETQSLKDDIRVYMELLARRADTTTTGHHGTAESFAAIESPLTDRELEVLAMIAEGKSNKETAAALQISDQTVKNHISHIFAKLGVNDRTSAVLMAVNQGWIRVNRPQHSKVNT